MLPRLIALLIGLACSLAHAESVLGLEPLEPLSSVKRRFNPENLTAEPVGWLKSNQYFGVLQTPDMSGKVLLLFEHDDEVRKKKLAALEKSVTGMPVQSQARSTRLLLRQQKEHLAKPLDDRLALVLVRWIPDPPLRVAELTAKYGKPEEKRERDAVYGPIYVWSKGVTAHLSDDKKFISMVEYWFTEDDLALYFLNKLPGTR